MKRIYMCLLFLIGYSNLFAQTPDLSSYVEFDGEDDFIQFSLNSNENNPLRRGAVSVPISAISGKTANVGQPWATVVNFRFTDSSNKLYLWSQTNGNGQYGLNPRVALFVDSFGKLRFHYGDDFNNLKWKSTDALETDTWYAVYMDYNGASTGLSSSNIFQYYSRFRIKLVELSTNVISEISGEWSSLSAGFGNNIRGDFFIGSLYQNTRNFKGAIKSMVMTTLRTNQDLPTDAEISMMTKDPLDWLETYKEGKPWRQPNQSNDHPDNFRMADYDADPVVTAIGSLGTKVWMMGDGNGDTFSNQVDPEDDDQTGEGSGSLDDNVVKDSDGDGVTDNIDVDDDNDGILDTYEGSDDLDNDGIINSLDTDSDGDGCNDVTEAGFDLNQDGIIDGTVDGEGKLVVDVNGKVAGQLTLGSSWYVTTPRDSDNSAVGDHLEADIDDNCTPPQVTTISNFSDLSKEEGDSSFTLAATSNSTGAIITYSKVSGDASITVSSTGTVTVGSAGAVVIRASVTATATHASATKDITLTITEMVDTDGDGVADKNDLDADNDGILNADECGDNTDYIEFSRLVSSNNATYTLLDTQITLGVSGGINLINTDDSGNLALTSNNNLRTLTVSTDNPVDFLISQATNASIFFGTPDTWTLTIGDGSLSWEDPSSELDVISSTQTSIQFSGLEQNPEGWQIKLNNVTNYTLTMLSQFSSDLNVQITVPCLDTDNDNIANYLETDGDGDGCDDYKEAGFDTDFNDTIDNATKNGNIYTVDTSGKIQGHDYTKVPLDVNTNGVKDHIESGYRQACLENPNISFTPVSDQIYGSPDVTLLASSSNSSGTISYSIDASGTTSISSSIVDGNKVRLGSVGSVVVTASIAASGEYNAISETIEFDIRKAALTINANAKNKVYGTENPALTFSYGGLVNGDSGISELPTISTTATLTSGVGVYPITLTGGSDDNYDITLEDETLTVVKATLTVTPQAGQTKVYGDPDPEFLYNITGFQHVDTEADLDTPISYYRVAGENVGTYIITPYGASDSNYDIYFMTEDFLISKRPITVTPKSGQSKAYGASDMALQYAFSPSLMGYDVISGSLSREQGESVGNYEILKGSLDAGSNYELMFTSGVDFEIKKDVNTPNIFSYQAILRDDSQQLQANTSVYLKIEILQGGSLAAPDQVVYTENHNTQTNSNGLMTVSIGAGITNDTFTGIDWSTGPYFIRISSDPNGGNDYSIVGTSQILAVPYAIHAKEASSIEGGIDASYIKNLEQRIQNLEANTNK